MKVLIFTLILIVSVVFCLAMAIFLIFMFGNRKILLNFGSWILARRYKVKIEDKNNILKCNEKNKVSYLVLPNHPAFVDPLLVVTAFSRIHLKAFVDESFFHAGIIAPRVLKTFGAVAVPDLRKNRSRTNASIARGLIDIVKGEFVDGGSVILYPSGHIQTDEDKEVIGTRQLAYNICKELPENVRVITVRTRGLWGSIWSRKGRSTSPSFVPTLLKGIGLWFFWSPFVRRRCVTIHIEDLTEHIVEWSKLTRLEFNHKLEEWYNK